ncbi:phage adaptor protein [Oligella urethralis]|uniref:Uncharacterized protein n=1 Tax=Oligella urethralis TaxID=90245 RepID=A0A2X1ULY8_9BURK|nr:hypothetical protein [Oligella urethralis]SPY08169.1 Uncharacterised protein [Oligella urethralis]
MNFTELRSTVADWLHRSDLNGVLPTFIKLAESRINRDLRTEEMVKSVTGSVTDSTITLPDDFRQAKSVLVNGKPVVYASSLESKRYDVAGDAYFYTIVGNQINIRPKSTSADYELIYYASIEPLSDNKPTNWLLAKYPDVYLYAVLLESAPYIKDNEAAEVWAIAYGNAIRTVAEQDLVAKHGDAGLVIRGNSV